MAKLRVPPKQKKAVGVAILKKKADVEKANNAVAQARTPQAKAIAVKKAAVETKQLAQIVKAVRPEKKKIDKKPVLTRVAAVVAANRMAQTQQEMARCQAQKKALQASLSAASPVQKAVIKAQMKQADESLRRLHVRRERQKKGVEIPAPRKLSTPSRRVPLRLAPPRPGFTQVLPDQAIILKMAKMIAKRTPRRLGESKLQYQQRLLALCQRASVRWMNGMAPAPSLVAETAILPGQAPSEPKIDPTFTAEQAVEETVKQDAEVIAQEIQQEGGVVQDPAADAVAEIVEDAIEPVAEAVGASESLEPEQLAVEAEASAAELIEESAKDETPFYKRPVVLALAGAAALVLILRR
jgi:hypothetical protein